MDTPRPQSWLFAALLLLSACAPMPEPRLRVGTVPWPGYEPFFLARELGLLPAQHIHLVEYMSSAQQVRAFRNGAIDAMTVSLEEVLRQEQLGHAPQVVLVLDISHGADCLMARPEVESLPGLKGRRIGTESTVALHLFHRMLEQAGLQREDVRLEISPLTTHAEAYQRGALDAVVTFEPYCQRLAGLGARRLFDSSHIPGEIVDVLVVRKEFLDTHPKQVDEVLRGWFATLAWNREHPQEGIRRMARRHYPDEQQFREALSGVRLMDEHAQHAQLTGPQPRLHESIARLRKLRQRHQALSTPPDTSRLLDAAPLMRVSP